MKNGRLWDRVDRITDHALDGGTTEAHPALQSRVEPANRTHATRPRARRGTAGLLAALNAPGNSVHAHVIRRDQGAAKAGLVANVGTACEACSFKMPAASLMHVHHVVPVAKGGDNCASNLVLLCPNCHALAHHAERTLASPHRDRHELLAYFGSQDGGHTPAGLPAAPGAQHADQGPSTQPGSSR